MLHQLETIGVVVVNYLENIEIRPLSLGERIDPTAGAGPARCRGLARPPASLFALQISQEPIWPRKETFPTVGRNLEANRT